MKANKQIVKFIESLLNERGYEVRYFDGIQFHSLHKVTYCSIELRVVDGEITLYQDINFASRGDSLAECIDKMTEKYNTTMADIEYVKKQLLDITRKDNLIRILEICEVPSDIIEYIENK